MAYEPKENSGVLFGNDRKTQDNHPDRTGSANVGGVDYWVSGWIKQGQKGQFLSLSFKPKDQQRGSTTKGRDQDRGQNRGRDHDSDIPW